MDTFFAYIFLCLDFRLSLGGCNVPLAEFSGAVLSLPAATATGGPIQGPAQKTQSPTQTTDEGAESFI